MWGQWLAELIGAGAVVSAFIVVAAAFTHGGLDDVDTRSSSTRRKSPK